MLGMDWWIDVTIGSLNIERVEDIFTYKFGSCCLEMADSGNP